MDTVYEGLDSDLLAVVRSLVYEIMRNGRRFFFSNNLQSRDVRDVYASIKRWNKKGYERYRSRPELEITLLLSLVISRE